MGAIPTTRPHQIAIHALGWNLTTGLDLLALLVLLGGFLLTRRGRPTEREGLFAVDPVCGMQVERASAPVQLSQDGGEVSFCSDRCRDRFQQHPERFGTVRSQAIMPPPSPMQVDPVCGMQLDPARAAAQVEYRGRQIYFCSPGCRDRFQLDPDRYSGDRPAPPSATETPGETDPVCGMEVTPGATAPQLVHDGHQFYFCSPGCRDRFLQHPDSFSSMRSLNIPTTQLEFPIDPICGMSVDPADPGARLDFPEGTVYFCCQPCADEYAAARAAGR